MAAVTICSDFGFLLLKVFKMLRLIVSLTSSLQIQGAYVQEPDVYSLTVYTIILFIWAKPRILKHCSVKVCSTFKLLHFPASSNL